MSKQNDVQKGEASERRKTKREKVKTPKNEHQRELHVALDGPL